MLGKRYGYCWILYARSRQQKSHVQRRLDFGKIAQLAAFDWISLHTIQTMYFGSRNLIWLQPMMDRRLSPRLLRSFVYNSDMKDSIFWTSIMISNIFISSSTPLFLSMWNDAKRDLVLCARTMREIFQYVAGATPPYLKIQDPLTDGIYRSDVLFADGNEKHPLRFVGAETREKILAEGLRIVFSPVEGI